MTSRETNYETEARSDAMSMAEDFADEMCQMWRDGRLLSVHVDDYEGGDERHDAHKDGEYSLTEADEVITQLRDHEETDNGLWEGLSPRDAISAQAAYTYAAAVGHFWRELVDELQSELEEVQRAIEGNPPNSFQVQVRENGSPWERLARSEDYPTREDAIAAHPEDDYTRIVEGQPEDYDEEEAVGSAGERYLRLYFVLDGMDDGEYGGMVGAARREAKSGEFTAALGLADAIYEERADSDNDGRRGKPEAIRAAVK